jgi:hypothetical protein
LLPTFSQTSAIDATRLWKELPSTVLCHILQQIPYKRVDVKGVCSSWRTAINRSLNSISMPAADLPLLIQLPDIKHLIIRGAALNRHTTEDTNQQQQQQQQQLPTWPPSSCCPRRPAASASYASCCAAAPPTSREDAAGSCWAAVEPRLLDKLQTLRLLQCPQVVQQLAEGLLQPLAQQGGAGSSSSSSGSRWCAPLPAFTALQVLEVDGSPSVTASVTTLLDAIQQQCTAAAAAAAAAGGGTGWSAQSLGTPLQQLQQLHIKSCSVQDNWPGSGSGRISNALQLLPQLPQLHTLQLSACVGMLEVPTAVLRCTGLTKLVLQNNEMLTELPAGVSQLSALQVRHHSLVLDCIACQAGTHNINCSGDVSSRHCTRLSCQFMFGMKAIACYLNTAC